MRSQRKGCFSLLHPIKISFKTINMGHININSIRFKFNSLQNIVQEDLISEMKLDSLFATGQFLLEEFKTSFSLKKE